MKLMSPGTPVDKSPFEGLHSAPQITLDPLQPCVSKESGRLSNDVVARLKDALAFALDLQK